MIKIDRDLEVIKNQVDTLAPTWCSRAKKRSREINKKAVYAEKTSIWSEVKPVFMYLQRNRCIYCDRHIASLRVGSVEHDLEHYRPKGRVTEEDGSHTNGYYWLAYDFENFAVACKTCNQGLKMDRFPILGTRGVALANVTTLNQTELPMLIFPMVDNPDEYMIFDGVTPKPKFKRGLKYKRAKITIDFFRLADSEREELHDARTLAIVLLWNSIRTIELSTDIAEREQNLELIKSMCSPEFPHSMCTKFFYALVKSNREKARDYFLQAHKYVIRNSDKDLNYFPN